ncbi:MAG: DinB family protein [Bacteroidota bacterium]
MQFNLQQSIDLLSRTPATLESILSGLPDEWLHTDEGPDTWSPYTVLGHLIHGEKTDWIPRSRIILSDDPDKRFKPFDRFAQLTTEQASIEDKLAEFRQLRLANMAELRSWNLTEADLEKEGIHPEFGAITLGQMLSTWPVHDLGHIAQISRVMAKQYKEAIGPWIAYLRIVR